MRYAPRWPRERKHIRTRLAQQVRQLSTQPRKPARLHSQPVGGTLERIELAHAPPHAFVHGCVRKDRVGLFVLRRLRAMHRDEALALSQRDRV